MATKTDPTSEKKRKQYIVLAVGGVLLLALAAFQLPKLTGGSSESAPASSTTTTDETSTTAPTSTSTSTSAPTSIGGTSTSTPVVPTLPVAGPGAIYVAGVAVTPAGSPKATQSQLWSISRFKWKDPFVQQVKEAEASSSTAAAPPPPPAPSTGSDSVSPPPAGQVATAKPTFATVAVNGTPTAVAVKKAFPADTKQFTLVALTPTSATVSVRGGSFKGGKTVALQLNQPVTLVNEQTGKRYRLQLLYVGAAPEQVTSYSP